MQKLPHYKQTEDKDFGLTCIKILAKHYEKIINTQRLCTLSETTRSGSSLLGISEALKKWALAHGELNFP